MPDQTYLDWPFLESRHRLVAEEAEDFASTQLRATHHDSNVDQACRSIAARMGGVEPDGAALHRAERHLLGGGRRPDGEHGGPGHPVRVADAPLEHPHATHRPADHPGPTVDAEVVGEERLRGDLVPDRELREP